MMRSCAHTLTRLVIAHYSGGQLGSRVPHLHQVSSLCNSFEILYRTHSREQRVGKETVLVVQGTRVLGTVVYLCVLTSLAVTSVGGLATKRIAGTPPTPRVPTPARRAPHPSRSVRATGAAALWRCAAGSSSQGSSESLATRTRRTLSTSALANPTA